MVFDSVTDATAALLIVTAFFTSMFTASFGAGGGVMMLSVMAQVVPPSVIIPLHGIIQLGSNGGRALMSYSHIDWALLKVFVPGVMVGSCVGLFVLVSLPTDVIYLTIAGFVLFLCWGPTVPPIVLGKMGVAIAGGVTAFIGLFVGASGPLVGAFVKQIHVARLTTIATFAAAMSAQHVTKLVVFSQVNVDFLPWLPLLLCMIIVGAIGTWFGLHVVKRMSDVYFQHLFKFVLTALALRLIWQAFI